MEVKKMHIFRTLAILLSVFLSFAGFSQEQKAIKIEQAEEEKILPGAYLTGEYLNLLKGKKVGIVANHTSFIKNTHLIDSLLALGVKVAKIFGPEHGFRGDQPDGKEIGNNRDAKTGIEVISLYGSHKKPTVTDMQNIDIVLFDIQDVGARFYTYISTLTYIMEACAENNIPLIVTDRPNPNGFYIDGPVLDPDFTSFVGMHSVPIVYGMTIGEYATMVNGEKWLAEGKTCSLTVIKCKNYSHNSRYQLPIRPSPNLQDMKSVYLYPSLCLFEGTVVSIGRGTSFPFRVYGHPLMKNGSFDFTPQPIKGVSENPPLKGQKCYGHNLSEASKIIKNKGEVELTWLLDAYNNLKHMPDFFNSYFNKLAGNSYLREQIIAGKKEADIRDSWKPGLEKFKLIRKKYLLYPDFE